MAIGPGIYFNKYKDYSNDELERGLEKLQKYLSSDELKKARQEEIDKKIDDNNCIENVRTEIDVKKDLIKTKKEKFKSGELNNNENHRCPICFSILKEYVYGKIKGEINTDKYIVGGCILRENNPTYYCSKCNYDYDKNLNLMTETLEKVIESFIGNDPFWKDLLKEYFNKLTNKSEEEKISFLKKIALNKNLFNEFTKDILKSSNPEILFDKYNKPKSEFSQDELKDFFFYCMTEKELEKIKKLDLNRIISKIQSSTYQVKYIESVGYIFIGEGYLILDDGTEPTHYFAKIFNSEEEAKNEIINIYNEKFLTNDILKCPSCDEKLMFLHPDGSYLYCNKCEKYYLNNNGEVGDETTSPYDKNDDVLY